MSQLAATQESKTKCLQPKIKTTNGKPQAPTPNLPEPQRTNLLQDLGPIDEKEVFNEEPDMSSLFWVQVDPEYVEQTP